MNPYASPWDLWLLKTGQKEPIEQNAPMEWGNRLEPAIRQKYVDDTGATVYVPPDSLFHPEMTWARATPDGIVLNSDPAKEEIGHAWSHLLQIKNVNYWLGKEWEQCPPPYQEMWEMHVTGLDRADVAALIGGSDYRVFTIHRDDRAIADLVSIASDFWRRVEQRIPPEIDNSETCREHFEKRFAKSNAVELVADADVNGLFVEWRDQCRIAKNATKEIERLRNVVRSRLADAQADRIVSSIGIAKLDANKKLLAPREWSKE
jgi:putative phage-type endonuclease